MSYDYTIDDVLNCVQNVIQIVDGREVDTAYIQLHLQTGDKIRDGEFYKFGELLIDQN